MLNTQRVSITVDRTIDALMGQAPNKTEQASQTCFHAGKSQPEPLLFLRVRIIPSGYLTWQTGKSTFLIGKSSHIIYKWAKKIA